MDIAKIRSPSYQTVPSGSANIILNQLMFEEGTTVIANTSGSFIAVTEPGYYLVVIEVQVIGALATHTVFLQGNGFANAELERLIFNADPAGVEYGLSVLTKATAGAFFTILVINSGVGDAEYLCTLSVAKLARVA